MTTKKTTKKVTKKTEPTLDGYDPTQLDLPLPPTSDTDVKYKQLIMSLNDMNSEVDRGVACKKFAASVKDLVFMGFNPMTNEPLFQLING